MNTHRLSPIVSVIMANYNSGGFIARAVESVLAQTLQDLELIISDDGSTDDSLSVISQIGARDGRVRLLLSAENGGPATARNRAFDIARGRWIAIVDSDDLIHPERLEKLVACAERDLADIAADDLLIFFEKEQRSPRALLRGAAAREPHWVSLADYLQGNTLFSRKSALGYLKPIFRASLLADPSNRYNVTLSIGEDFDFVLRLLRQGARYRVYPELTYFYRKHGQSASHRLGGQAIEALLKAGDEFHAGLEIRDNAVISAFGRWRRAAVRAILFDQIVDALKQRDFARALCLIVKNPGAAMLLRLPIGERLRRIGPVRTSLSPSGRRRVCVLSRQRVVGKLNGSSTYLLTLCEEMRGRGYELDYLCPSPTVFGRWPVLILKPELRVFRTVTIRGGLQIGMAIVALNPVVFVKALMTLLGGALGRVGIDCRWLTRRAPYSIGMPLTRNDKLFLARRGQSADLLIADYVFLVGAIPYTLRLDVPSIVVMHDLFGDRAAQFAELGVIDAVALDARTELALLARTDAIVAIQETEAAIVRRALPKSDVILAPMSVVAVGKPQPGLGAHLLFVGSNTAPNVDGLTWFLADVWPNIRRTVPEATLTVAGTVSWGMQVAAPDGVSFLGAVSNLDDHYQRAAVVVVPLRLGSGLKIKLIEALGQGKAIVATSVAVEGVENLVPQVVQIADEAGDFAGQVVNLLRDEKYRLKYGDAALKVARQCFSATACYSSLLAFIERNISSGMSL
jgi:glycosyltransferase involved in cell wall biosynthesis